jgi:hypothetical protein
MIYQNYTSVFRNVLEQNMLAVSELLCNSVTWTINGKDKSIHAAAVIGLKCAQMIIIIGVLSRITSFETYKVVLTRLYAETLQHCICNPQRNLSMAKPGKSSYPVTNMFEKIISSFHFLITFEISFKLSWNSTYILHVLN